MPLTSIETAYRDESPQLAAFFDAWPKDIDLAAQHGPRDAQLLDELRVYQRSIDNGDPPVEHIDIVTGQQPALFAGPLYTVYKIATALRLAQRRARTSGAQHVAAFWLGSDDHDFEEARTAYILTRNHDPLALRYSPGGDVDGLPLFHVPLEPSLHDLIDQAAAAAPGSEYRDEVASFLHSSLDVSRSFSEWTARIVARLFRSFDVAIVTPELPRVRALARDIIAREIDDPLLSTRLVNDQGRALRALGFDQQVQKNDNECGFFLEVDRRRRKVTYESGVFTIHGEPRRYSQADLRRLLQEEPARFSPNVAVRCIVQHALFSPAAYVAGPGEIAYWAQFKTLFAAYGYPMPIVYPRAKAVLTTTKLKKLCERFGIAPRNVAGADIDSLLSDALRMSANDPDLAAFRKGTKEIGRVLNALARDVGKIPEARDAMRSRIMNELSRFEGMLLRADEERAQTVRRQIERIVNVLGPFRKPQERVYTVFSFLFEQGWDLVPRLVRELDIDSFDMNEIEL